MHTNRGMGRRGRQGGREGYLQSTQIKAPIKQSLTAIHPGLFVGTADTAESVRSLKHAAH